MKSFKEYINESEEYMYHATNMDNVYDMLDSNKLKTHKPSHGTDQETWPDGSKNKRSYWSHNEKTIESFYPEHGKPTKLRVKKQHHPFKQESTGDHYLEKDIPLDNIEIHHEGSWKQIKEV